MTAAYRVAVVEDNASLLADLVEFLRMRGFEVHGFHSAENFFEAAHATYFDLLLLDVALPGASGLDIARQVRAQGMLQAHAGIVMLTALEANDDHLVGLQAGADIYLSKRSSLEVIEATCRSLLRRLEDRARQTPAVDKTPWLLNVSRWQLMAPKGEWIDLTRAELSLLAALFSQPGTPIARELMLERLGKRETLPGMRNLDNIASRLRRKVQLVSGVELPLRPSYGKGYTFTGACEVQA